jgi:hypothetical protein
MVYWIYLYLKLIFVKANSVYLPESYATVVNWGYLVSQCHNQMIGKAKEPKQGNHNRLMLSMLDGQSN